MLALDLRHTPVILAIEDDSNQATWLASVVRRRVKAELLVSRSVEEAIRTMTTRVPDLVLLPALLAPRDETALMDSVRGNPAAAHVQMLTIPVLTAQESPAPARKLLGRFRREKGQTEKSASGQASAFADQIASSLKRALDRRVPTTAPVAVKREREEASPQAVEAPESSFLEGEQDAGIILELAGDPTTTADIFATLSELAIAPEFSPPMPELTQHALPRPMLPRWTWPPAYRRKIQDAWDGLDPLQCGFPALLARLDESTRPKRQELNEGTRQKAQGKGQATS